jgi:hypothetical protein
MPDVSTLMLAAGAWLLLLVFVVALCTAAGRADGDPRRRAMATEPPVSRGTAVVVDTGGLRAHLRAGATLIEAEQLTVTADVGGTEVVLASSRAVVEAAAGQWPELAAPVRLADGAHATLRAVRRPGARGFDESDRILVDALAARVSGSLAVAHPSTTTNLESPNALA